MNEEEHYEEKAFTDVVGSIGAKKGRLPSQ
jgi:hypothetical protein